MLKKFGLVAVGVTAGLVAVAPLATASEGHDGNRSCSADTDAKGNTGLFNECNETGNRVGEGNTFNGQPVDNPFANLVQVPIQDV